MTLDSHNKPPSNLESQPSQPKTGIPCHFGCGSESDPGGLKTAKAIYQTGKDAIDFLSKTTSTCQSGNILCDLVMSSLELLMFSGDYSQDPQKLKTYYEKSETLIVSRIMCLNDASTYKLCGIYNHILALMHSHNRQQNEQHLSAEHS